MPYFTLLFSTYTFYISYVVTQNQVEDRPLIPSLRRRGEWWL